MIENGANGRKLFNGLIVFSLLLPVLLTGNPTTTRAAPEATRVPIGLNKPLLIGTASVELSPGSNGTANPGSIVTYTHTLTNTGTGTDTFTLEVSSSHGWPVAVLGATGALSLPLELEAGLTATLLVSLTVPTAAISGTLDTAVLTATSQTIPDSWAVALDTTTVKNVIRYVYLPLVIKRWPPVPDVPVLNPISNPDGDGNYTVGWNPGYRVDTYILQEDDTGDFSSPTTQYTGSGTSWSTSRNTAGTYYYRVKATNSWGESGWSNIQSVIALPGAYGRVTYQGNPIGGVPINLWCNSCQSITPTIITTQADGTYYFPNLTPDNNYQVVYENGGDLNFVGYCTGFLPGSYTAGARIAGGDFDIASIPLLSPPNGATIVLPYTFHWTPRIGLPSDNYRLEIRLGTNWWQTSPLGYVGQYTLDSLPYQFSYGTQYQWDVWTPLESGQLGGCVASGRTVTFSRGVTSSQDTGGGLRMLPDGNSDIVDVSMTRMLRK